MTAQIEKRISVLLVDDHPPIRAGLRAMFDKTFDIDVVGEADNSDEARRLLDELRPDIILLDLVMPGFSPSAFEKWARGRKRSLACVRFEARETRRHQGNQ